MGDVPLRLSSAAQMSLRSKDERLLIFATNC